MPGLVAYDPNDKEQRQFLAVLARGETGGGTGSSMVGFGGIDLSNASPGEYGFPQWEGNAEWNTHAAGTYQFQPATWRDIASRYGLDFQNSRDQDAGAYYLAQEAYARNTNGRSLDADLDAGNVNYVEGALASVWPSMTGNAALPGGFSEAFGRIQIPGSPGTEFSIPGIPNGADIGNFFQRSGLVILGGIIVLVALWAILASTGVVPGPKEVVGVATRAVTA